MNREEDASGIEQMLISRAYQKKAPVRGSIELLPLCNMNCEMCYVRLSRSEMEAQGQLRTAAQWLELGRQMQKSGVLFLLLTGGEPLLYEDFKEVYLGLRKLGLILTINTNGTLLNEAWSEFFAQNPPRRINITLYGSDRETYAKLCHYPEGFEKAVNAIKLLRDRSIDVKINVSLTPYNQTELMKLHELGESLGVPVRVDTYMMPAERERSRSFGTKSRLDPIEAARGRIDALKREMGEKLFDEYVQEKLEQIERGSELQKEQPLVDCMAGNCSFTINWQGEMRPCVVMTDPSASVFELGFENAWRQIRRETDQIRLSSRCAACCLKPLCRSCAASALLETGTYDGVPDYMCQYTEESLRLIREYASQKLVQ